MKTGKNYSEQRRNAIKMMGLGAGAGLLGFLGGSNEAHAMPATPPYEPPAYAKGLPPIKIKSVKAITTKAGGNSNLIIVKVETTEPGLYGLGCATFTQRAEAVVTAIDRYLAPFAVDRDADNIEDMWKSMYVSSYWRNGGVLNNAMSGLDQALWDIKGKRANMPVYQLLGGKTRFAVDTYTSVGGATVQELAANVTKEMEAGQRVVKISLGGGTGGGGRGGAANGASASAPPNNSPWSQAGYGKTSDRPYDEMAYLKSLPVMFEGVRKICGEDIDLCHDVHEKVQPMNILNTCKILEQYRPFFIEDPLSPENISWWKQLRESTTVPFAMGELWNNVNEFIDPIVNHYFDYIRIHVSQIGGITQAMKVARLGEWFNVKTAWHGPGDVSPIGHSAQAHMDLALTNFGIQEGGATNMSDAMKAVFPGGNTKKNGYIYVNEAPGLGIDINEKEAAKYPITNSAGNWTIRRNDGSVITP